MLPAPANGTGNGWDFLAGAGSDLASVADEAYCIGSPFGCAMSYLGGTAPSQLYQDFVTSQGIDTPSGAYFAGTLTGTILLTAAGGAVGAAADGLAAVPEAADPAATLEMAVRQQASDVIASQSIRVQGPVLSGAMDTKTGEIFPGQNTGIPDPLHPDLQQLLDDFPGPGAPGKGIPGSHAEINALNQRVVRAV